MSAPPVEDLSLPVHWVELPSVADEDSSLIPVHGTFLRMDGIAIRLDVRPEEDYTIGWEVLFPSGVSEDGVLRRQRRVRLPPGGVREAMSEVDRRYPPPSWAGPDGYPEEEHLSTVQDGTGSRSLWLEPGGRP